MKVVVTNAVVSNTGDAAIFQGIRESILAAGVAAPSDITLLDSNAAVTRGLYPGWRILQQPTIAVSSRGPVRIPGRSRLRRETARFLRQVPSFASAVMDLSLASRLEIVESYRALREADLVVSTGGTYLVDHYDFEFRARELELAAAYGSSPILWTQSAGPFRTAKAQGAARRIAGVAAQVYARDEPSREAFRRVGVRAENVNVVPDVAFCIRPPDDAPAPGARVLVSVRDWHRPGAHGQPVDIERYRGALVDAAARCRRDGLNVTAMSTCQGIPGYVDDAAFASEVFSGCAVEVDSQFHTPDALIEEIRKSRVVITTRMHMAILALICRVPTIAIGYEFKTLELFRSIGLGRFAVAMEDITSAWLDEALTAIATDPDSARLDPAVLDSLRCAAALPARDLVPGPHA